MKMLHALLLAGALTSCAEAAVEEPVPLSDADSPFRYPLELWDQRIEGSPLVAVRVTEAGGVDSVQVVQTSGYEAFDSAAIEGARQLRFIPARRGDRTVVRWIRVPVRFVRPDAAGAGAANARP